MAAGCLIVALVALGMFWLWLTARDSDSAAWGSMPGSTYAAAEMHGVHDLFAALEDDGVVALAMAQLSLAGDEPLEIGRFLDWTRSYVELYRPLRSFLTPDTIILGLAKLQGEDIPFVIVSASGWMRLPILFVSKGEGVPARYPETGGEAFHYAFKSGWCVLSQSSAIVEEVMNNWNSGRHGLGKAPARDAAFAALALRPGGRNPESVAASDQSSDPNPFLAGMPPPGQINTSGAPSPRKDAGLWRMLVQAGAGAWEIRGGWVGDALSESDDFAVSDANFGPAYAGKNRDSGGGFDFALAMPSGPGVGPGYKFGQAFPEPAASREAPWKVLSWQWARWGWLEHASGNFVFSAAPAAVASHDKSLPALPLFTLGWRTWGDVIEARDSFNKSFSVLFEALTAPGGRPILQTLRESARIRPFGTAKGGGFTIEMPPVLAYGAKPSWFFYEPKPNGSGFGFMASDPAGLPDGDPADRFAWPEFSRGRDILTLSLSGSWSLGDPFRRESLAILREAMETLKSFDAETARFASAAVSALDSLTSLYPKGAVSVLHDPMTAKTAFKAAIPRPKR